jgi:hypothetical protein
MVYALLGLNWCGCPEIGTNSIDWAQLSRFHLKMETECSLRDVVCFNKTGRWIKSRNTIVEIIAVCCENHKKHINTLCLKNVFLNVKTGGTYSYQCASKSCNYVTKLKLVLATCGMK